MAQTPAVSYTFSRLGFKADKIEPLADDQAFRIVTPDGTFQMTKAEFYRVFANVVKTPSYTVQGIYHYRKPPRRIEPYRLAGPTV